MAETLFDKYGGFETFNTLVINFYRKVLDDPNLEKYFSQVNMEKLIDHQTHFISKLLGGPDRYKGKDLKQAHKGMNITTPDFIEVAELLEETLEDANVEAEDIKTIIEVFASFQHQIVNNT
ncbi:MAG: group 1 truncated hemoglobin [Saccharospirillaceae bacterium]|nr:group 1 truncated hemoglobin [Pseudomonadales bacterium]NRB80202.1 group 1 truncated hemoglobin [Saccharospirillaceae bacterium]